MPVLGLVYGIDKLIDGAVFTLVASETDRDVDPKLTESDADCMPVLRLVLGRDTDVADGRLVESPAMLLLMLRTGAEPDIVGRLLIMDPKVAGLVAVKAFVIIDNGRDTE